jgi:mannosyltransferase OCH1-like enzyme
MTSALPVKNHKNIWLYWEHREGVSIEPAYIRLCRKAIYTYAGNATVHLVTPENLHAYLPNLPKNVEKIRRKGTKDYSIAMKCDVIRAYLLQEYGGLYLDSDTIPLQNMDPIFDLLDAHDFIAMQCESHGDHHIPNGVFGTRAQGIVIRKYVNAIRRKMFTKFLLRRDFGWTSLGQSALTRVVNRNKQHCHLWPEKRVQPITWQDEKTFLATDIEPADVIPDDGLFFTLYHGVFQNELKEATEDELMNSDMLLSKVFRRALND